jgi:hypothetical protein
MLFSINIAKKYPVQYFLLMLCILLLAGIEVRTYFSPLPAHKWIAANLENIKVADKSNFSFAVFGENKGSKFVFENMLKLIDHDQAIIFAIDLGGFVESGEKREYHYFLKQIKSLLSLPVLTVIGNNELMGNGRSLYYDIFGSGYYSFQIGKNYFIILDDAEGFDQKQEKWLKNELDESIDFDNCIVFIHLPLFDPRAGLHNQCLNEKVSSKLTNIFLKYRVSHVFASHIPGFYEGSWGKIPYTTTGWAGMNFEGNDAEHEYFHFLKVQIRNDSLNVKVQHVPSEENEWMNFFSYFDPFYIYAFKIHWIESFLLLFIGGVILVIWKSNYRGN